jgi:hypothetical protein
LLSEIPSFHRQSGQAFSGDGFLSGLDGGKVAQWLGDPIAHHPFPLFCFRMKEEERKRMFAIGSFLYAQVETGLYVRFQVLEHYFSM